MFRKLNKRAQTTAEYAILIALVVGAIVAMQVYVRRGLQGKVKDSVDYDANKLVGAGGLTGFTFTSKQYEPYYNESNLTTTQKGSDTTTFKAAGAVDLGTNMTTNRAGTQKVTGGAIK